MRSLEIVVLQRSGSGLYTFVFHHYFAITARLRNLINLYGTDGWQKIKKRIYFRLRNDERVEERTLSLIRFCKEFHFWNVLFIRFSKRGLEYGELSVNVNVMFVTLVTMISLSDKIGKFCFNISSRKVKNRNSRKKKQTINIRFHFFDIHR